MFAIPFFRSSPPPQTSAPHRASTFSMDIENFVNDRLALASLPQKLSYSEIMAYADEMRPSCPDGVTIKPFTKWLIERLKNG